MGIHSGGPSRSVLSLTKGLRDISVDSVIITNNDTTDSLISTEPWIHAVPYHRNFLKYNHRFKRELQICDYELFHVHSVFSYPSTIAMRVAEKRTIPFIVSPRGSLLKTALSISSKWTKSAFNKFILIPDLNQAAAVHATSAEEMDDIFTLGVKRPVILLPNSIQLPRRESVSVHNSTFRVGVCGRINPIKNLDGILRAWSKAGMDKEPAELVIIGEARLDRELSYLEELHKLETELQLRNVVWKGALFGKELQRALESLSVLLLASHSENFGMVVPESLALGIPVIASHGTPWEDLVKTESGWWIANSVESMSNTLLEVFNLYSNNWERMNQMGKNGIQYVKDIYDSQTVALKWKAAYSWLLENSQCPSFVYYP